MLLHSIYIEDIISSSYQPFINKIILDLNAKPIDLILFPIERKKKKSLLYSKAQKNKKNKTMSNTNNGQLVPESVLKRKHDLDELKAKRQSAELHNPRGNRKIFSSKNKLKIRKPHSFVTNAKMRKHHTQRYNRVMKKGMQKRASKTEIMKTKEILMGDDLLQSNNNNNTALIQNEPVDKVTYKANSVNASFVFAIRIRDGAGSPYPVQKALRTLRLNHVNQGIFIQYTKSAKKLLHLVEPFVIYGIPSKSIVSDLIVRRGHARIQGKRTPLSDNRMVEDALGESTGMICLEDLVHEIMTTGPYFTKVVSFLAPFHFTARISKFQKDKLNEKDAHDYGDKGELIDEYIRFML